MPLQTYTWETYMLANDNIHASSYAHSTLTFGYMADFGSWYLVQKILSKKFRDGMGPRLGNGISPYDICD